MRLTKIAPLLEMSGLMYDASPDVILPDASITQRHLPQA